MGPSTWDCRNTLYGFGDNTAGPVWNNTFNPNNAILGGPEEYTNYPVGDNTYNPTVYSLVGQSFPINMLSKALGPVCGYNAFNALGFVVSATVMFGFILALTSRRWIAWLAGFAVSFAPYYQMKVGGHPGYGYQAILIAIAWAFFNLIKRRRKRDTVALGALMAAAFYFDPYFSLLAVFIAGPLVIAWLALAYLRRRRNSFKPEFFMEQFKAVAMAALVSFVLILPLVFVTLTNSEKISSSVAAIRGDVKAEAAACSNLPHEYAAPFVLNPVFGKIFGKEKYVTVVDSLHVNHTCGIGEDSVGISLTILVITSLGLVIIAWERLNKRRLHTELSYDSRLVVVGFGLIILASVAIALPPVKLLGVVPTPSYVMLELTTTWRTLARMFVNVNLATIVLFSVVITIFAQMLRKHRSILALLFLILFGGVLVEYQAFRPLIGNKLSTFTYDQDVPPVYHWLSKQDDIHVVAEYPLERAGGESNAMAYYLSMQVAHKKKLFNGNIPTTRQEQKRGSLKDITDSQTVSVLGSLGVDTVIIHGVPARTVASIAGLDVVYSSEIQPQFNILNFTPTVGRDTVVVARVHQSNARGMLDLSEGFVRNTNIIHSAADWEYEALNNSIIKIATIPGITKSTPEPLTSCFEIKMAAPTDVGRLTMIIDGKPVDYGVVDANYRKVTVTATSSIKLRNEGGKNMRIQNLGCPIE